MMPLQSAPPAIVAPKPAVAQEIPIELSGNLIVARAKVNGKDVRLVVDSAAGMSLITRKCAAKLGIEGGVPILVGGGGERSSPARMVSLERVECAGASVKSSPAVVLDLPAGAGEEFDGILGNTFLKNFAVRIDYARKRLTLLPPGAFQPKNGTILPITLRQNIPEVFATVDGVSGSIRVDTGYAGTFQFTSPTVAREKLTEKYSKRVPTITGVGLGGPTRGEAVRVGAIRLGAHELKGVVGYLSTDKGGVLADGATIGLLGAEVLARFTVTLDYPGKRLHLVKNASFDAPFVFARAGLSGTMGESGYEVLSVVPESPAAEAPIEVGEWILAIDGKPVRSLGLSGIRESFRRPPGTVVTLRVKDKSGTERDARMTLRDLL